jgi:dihydropteroate synthase
LQEGILQARVNGIDQIIVDPGIGFGKTVSHNLQIIRDLKEFQRLGYPVLVGPSRKSFIGKILDLPVDQRLEGTAAAVAASIMNGANIIRVHDVKQMKHVSQIIDAIVHA